MEGSPVWTVVSGGRSLVDLMASLGRQSGWRIGPSAREILLRSRITIVPSVVHELAVIKGEEIGPRYRRTTENILREARRRRFETPSPEAALLLRERFPQDALGYSRLIIFHKPLRDQDHHPSLLALCYPQEAEVKRNLLVVLEAYPQTMWKPTDAFVFLAPRRPPLITPEHHAVNRGNRSPHQPQFTRMAWP